jgi:hypothetical protein
MYDFYGMYVCTYGQKKEAKKFRPKNMEGPFFLQGRASATRESFFVKQRATKKCLFWYYVCMYAGRRDLRPVL